MPAITDHQAILVRELIEVRKREIETHVGAVKFEEMHAPVDPASTFAFLAEPPHDDAADYGRWLELHQIALELGHFDERDPRKVWGYAIQSAAYECGCERRRNGEALTAEQHTFLDAERETQVF